MSLSCSRGGALGQILVRRTRSPFSFQMMIRTLGTVHHLGGPKGITGTSTTLESWNLPRRKSFSSIRTMIPSSIILCPIREKKTNHTFQNHRFFHSESEYHTKADETLENLQDVIEESLEEEGISDFEVTLASGVLTLVFPPHGTWVINKQTPNQQLWWSSPISGPRRYEYKKEEEDGDDGEWIFTRDDSDSMTLETTLKEEILQIYNVHLDL